MADYYREIMDKLHLKPEECLMAGNNTQEDMVAEQLGMKVLLLADCLINKTCKDISQYPHSGFVHLDTYWKGIIL